MESHLSYSPRDRRSQSIRPRPQAMSKSSGVSYMGYELPNPLLAFLREHPPVRGHAADVSWPTTVVHAAHVNTRLELTKVADSLPEGVERELFRMKRMDKESAEPTCSDTARFKPKFLESKQCAAHVNTPLERALHLIKHMDKENSEPNCSDADRFVPKFLDSGNTSSSERYYALPDNPESLGRPRREEGVAGEESLSVEKSSTRTNKQSSSSSHYFSLRTPNSTNTSSGCTEASLVESAKAEESDGNASEANQPSMPMKETSGTSPSLIDFAASPRPASKTQSPETTVEQSPSQPKPQRKNKLRRAFESPRKETSPEPLGNEAKEKQGETSKSGRTSDVSTPRAIASGVAFIQSALHSPSKLKPRFKRKFRRNRKDPSGEGRAESFLQSQIEPAEQKTVNENQNSRTSPPQSEERASRSKFSIAAFSFKIGRRLFSSVKQTFMKTSLSNMEAPSNPVEPEVSEIDVHDDKVPSSSRSVAASNNAISPNLASTLEPEVAKFEPEPRDNLYIPPCMPKVSAMPELALPDVPSAPAQLEEKVEHHTDVNPREVYKEWKIIGEGGYGLVFLCSREDGTKVAMKRVPLSTDEFMVQSQKIEEQILCELRHPNLLRCNVTYRYAGFQWLEMEFMAGGSLFDVIKKLHAYKMRMPEPVIARILRNVLEALVCMHRNGFIHRDIKSENVLLTESGDAKLADFGCAAPISTLKPNRCTLIGTPMWMAPDYLDDIYDAKVDVWAVGILAIECCELIPPHNSKKAFEPITYNANRPPRLEDHRWSGGLRDFVDFACQVDPARRPTAEQLLKQPFFLQGCASSVEPIFQSA